jgi:hypothetical protein
MIGNGLNYGKTFPGSLYLVYRVVEEVSLVAGPR